MPYNDKQYRAALDFFQSGNDNVTNPWDLKRVQSYDLYEELLFNSTYSLKLVLRGEDQVPMLVPSGRKIIEATHRFLAKDFNFMVDEGGDAGTRELVNTYFESLFTREMMRSKMSSNVRWGLVRGDACFYVYGEGNKNPGERISIVELDPRNYFEIEGPDPDELLGCHIVELVQDFRDPTKPDKKVARRRTFRKTYDENGFATGVTTELTHWEVGKWDDRDEVSREKMERVVSEEFDEPVEPLPPTITQLPVYKWRNNAPQNSSWGHSQLTGLETLMYGLNQSLTDEDATLVFQGLGMYVTTSGPPRDPITGQVTDWNIGPKQIIEIGQEQRFERVTGVTGTEPFDTHMDKIDKHISEGAGTPEIAIGRVDVAVAESGISLQLQLMPLLAQNEEKELEMVIVLDQMFYDLVQMWLPAYEPEYFGNYEALADIRVVTIFGDATPVNRDAKIQEIVLLDSSNLILKTMVISELRDLGYRYPTVDPLTGQPLTDEDIAAMLMNQQAQLALASDPFALQGGGAAPEEDTPGDQEISLGQTE